MASRLPSLLPLTMRALRRSHGTAPALTGATRISCVLPTARSLLRPNAVACTALTRRFTENGAGRKVVTAAKPGQSEAASDDGEEWTTIFRYPHIKALRMLCRVKIYQSIITLAIAPPLLFAEYMEWTPRPMNAMLLSLTFSATIVLFVTGFIAQRVIGIMYVNKDCTKLRVGHLTFWGSRQDHVYDTADVAQFADTGQMWGSWYVQLHRYSAPNDPLLVSLKHGGIVDRERFEKVFGRDVARFQ
uniref:Transmembrane protein 186 n=1 Tax=Amblyomma aureolatum TaxID=187763 RepID=A0A1E1X8C7_9ACAR